MYERPPHPGVTVLLKQQKILMLRIYQRGRTTTTFEDIARLQQQPVKEEQAKAAISDPPEWL